MGYQSQVTVSLTGRPDDVHLVLNTYGLSETAEQIKQSWHILGEPTEFEFYAEELRTEHGEKTLSLCWKFDWVKFYQESQEAVERLGSIVQTMNGEHDAKVHLKYRRVGEEYDDYESTDWGDDTYFDDAVEYVRYLNVEMPEADIEKFRTNKTVDCGNVPTLMPTVEGEANAS